MADERTERNAIEAALRAKSSRSKGQHPDGPISFTNVDVVVVDKDGSIPLRVNQIAFVVDLDKVSRRGGEEKVSTSGKVNISEVKETKDKNGNTRETGGSVMLASFNKDVQKLKLGVMGGERHDIHVGMNITIRP